MYRIIDDRATGKTSRLMLLAKKNNGILVCANPYGMRAKASAYGITDLEVISYYDYANKNYDEKKLCFIDEIETFVASLGYNFYGYSLSVED